MLSLLQESDQLDTGLPEVNDVQESVQLDTGLPEVNVVNDTGENSKVDSQEVADEIGLAGVQESDQLDTVPEIETGLPEENATGVPQEVQVVKESVAAYQVEKVVKIEAETGEFPTITGRLETDSSSGNQ